MKPSAVCVNPVNLPIKEQRLEKLLLEMEKVLVAFSGGVDSTFLLYKAVQILGKEKVLAVTGVSYTLPRKDIEQIRRIVSQLNVPHVEVQTKELSDQRFASNPENRCFYCKDELYTKLKELAQGIGYRYIIDGTNADDEKDYRPGREAARIHQVASPLLMAGLCKKDIRQLSKKYGLETWDRPSSPCLSSRFPYGTLITVEKLAQVEQAEEYLKTLGFTEFRVRHCGDTARIELLLEEMPRIYHEEVRNSIVAYFQSLGYTYVTLNLEGFKSGNLNRKLTSISDKIRYVKLGEDCGRQTQR